MTPYTWVCGFFLSVKFATFLLALLAADKVIIFRLNSFLESLFIKLTNRCMFRFGISRDSDCARCGEVESYRHLFWECPESGRVWRAYKPCILSLN